MADQRQILSDKSIARLPFAREKQYKVRDSELLGFFVLIGKRRKSFMAQGEFWRDGVREFAAQVKLGEFGEMTTREARGKGPYRTHGLRLIPRTWVTLFPFPVIDAHPRSRPPATALCGARVRAASLSPERDEGLGAGVRLSVRTGSRSVRACTPRGRNSRDRSP